MYDHPPLKLRSGHASKLEESSDKYMKGDFLFNN